MSKILSLLLLVSLSFFSQLVTVSAGTEETMIRSVMKLKTYARETTSGNYSFTHWGSAVMLDSKRVITNAHVILDVDGTKPTGYYELCSATEGKRDPVCFGTAKLISYDTVADLALLELTSPISSIPKLAFSEKKLSIGTSTIVYGYPQIGGSNITRTEGKIGGTEGDTYKFDGTIDHGNSGGGAFDKDGKLVGIPYAVRSDNGMIGYIIPIATVQDFLAGKTYNKEKYTIKNSQDFTTYIKRIELLSKNPNLIKTKKVEIKNAAKAGFALKSAVESQNGNIFDYRFIDKNERVAIVLICTNDASPRRTSLDIEQESYKLKSKNPTYTITGSYLDTAKEFFLSTAIPNKESGGERTVTALLFYKKAPMCNTYVVANDGLKKDKALYAKALEFSKTFDFKAPGKLTSDFVSQFFTAKNLADLYYIGEGTSFSERDILPVVHVTLSPEYTAYSRLQSFTIDTLDDYMNIGHSEDGDYYEGTDYSFDAFWKRYRTTGESTIEDMVITSKNGKKMILSTIDKTDSDNTPVQEKTAVIVLYPFKTMTGELKAYQFNFEFDSRNKEFITKIKTFFESIELPGTSPFN